MMNKVALVFVVLCACTRAYGANDLKFDPKKCSFTVEESNRQMYTYDLSSLGEVSVEQDGYFYRLNMCGGVSKGCSSDTAVCMSDSNNETFVSLGNYLTRETVSLGGEEPGEGFVVLFSKGDPCPDSKYTSTVLVLCDPTTKKPEVQVLPDDCDYSFQIITSFGCGVPAVPSSSSGSSSPSGSSPQSSSSASIRTSILSVVLSSVLLLLAHF